MEKVFQSLNHFSHRELFRFGLQLLDEYDLFGSSYKKKLAQRVRSEIYQYGSLIEKINEKSIGLLLDDFEGRRYEIWEQIISFLDKQLQVQISPFDKDWDLTTPEKQILKHIPSYKAAHFILYDLCADYTHYSRKVYGYIYSRDEMDKLLGAMQTVRALHAVELLGLEEKIREYQRVQFTFERCIDRYEDLKEIFQKLSLIRVRVCLGLVLILHKIPRFVRKFPPPAEVTVKEVSPLLVSRPELVCDAQRLSFNDFSHQNLLILSQRMLEAREQQIEDGLADFPLAAELERQVVLYKMFLDTVSADELGPSFDQMEGRRYRSFELLISTVERFMHGDADWSDRQWIKHGASPEYEAAEYLLYDTCLDYNHDFSPEACGHLCQSDLMDDLIESWSDFEAQLALKRLECLHLYIQYRECSQRCQSIAWRIERKTNSGIIRRLGKKRYEISLLLSKAARHLGANSLNSAT